jgi:hypothetical protein
VGVEIDHLGGVSFEGPGGVRAAPVASM